MLKLLILVSAINAGDMDNANYTLKALERDMGAKNIEATFIDASKDNDFIANKFSASQSGEPSIVMAIGDLGAKSLSILRAKIDSKNSYVYWSGHQFTKGIEDARVDHINLPQTAITKEQLVNLGKKNIKVTTTFAVPVKNPTRDELKEAYVNWNVPQKPSLSDSYIVVMLPGDAPDVDGKMKYFTKASATKLAADVEALWKSSNGTKKIIVQNGPRTGKHDPLTGKVECTHEHKKGEEAKVDEVSKLFVGILDSKQIPYRFFNFTFMIDGESKKANSVFSQLLYLSSNTNDSLFVMPGESVSLAGQLPLFIDPKNIIVFKSDSMNSGHEKIIEAGFNLGYLSLLKSEGGILYPKNPRMRNEDDAACAAKDLMDGFYKKFPATK